MAGPFYVDLDSPGSWQGRDGTNSASPWLGISGMQKALDTVVAGEICYVTGTGDLSKFYTVTYDASDGTTLTDGEEVTWDAGEGAWADGSDKGIVRVAASTAGGSGTVEIELTVGTMPSDNDVIKGTTSGHTITRAATANARKSLDVDTQTGTNAAGFIKFIGVDADYTGRTTRAIIDGASAATEHGFYVINAKDMYWWENIEVKRIAGTTKHGWCANGYGPGGHFWMNCCVNNCSGDGWGISSGYFKESAWVRCVAYSNTGSGFNSSQANNLVLFCTARQNTGSGFGQQQYQIGCVAWYNTVNGFNLTAAQLAMNCVADNNQGCGFNHSGSTANKPMILIANRVTSQNQAGTDAGMTLANEPCILGWNYFEDNGDDPADDIINDTFAYLLYEEGTTTDSNKYSQADTNEGYVSHPALHTAPDLSTNYVAADDPTLRRTAITLPWS